MDEYLQEAIEEYESLEKMLDLRDAYSSEFVKRSIKEMDYYYHPLSEYIIYLEKKLVDSGYLQNIIFQKNDKGEKIFEKLPGFSLKYMNINGKRYEAYQCNDLKFFEKKISDYFLKINESKTSKQENKLPAYSTPEFVKKKPIVKKEILKQCEKEINLEKKDNKREKELFKAHLTRVINFLDDNFNPEDSGTIEIKKVKGYNGHHFPSIILSSIDKISKIAPLHRIIHTDDTLALELENNMNIESIIKYLKKYYKKNF